MRTTVTIPVLLNTFCVLIVMCLSGCQSNGFQSEAHLDNPEQPGGTIRIVQSGKAPPECHEYDLEMVNAVGNRWKDLLSSRDTSNNKSGMVAVAFKLHFDGRISDLKPGETSMSKFPTLICQKSILDVAPFKRWPREIRVAIGKDSREITLTFYYQRNSSEQDTPVKR